jgi:hypothetical protein
MQRRQALVGLALVAAIGCGKSAEQEAAESAAKAAEQVAKGAEQMAQGAAGSAQQQMAQGMQQMAQGLQQLQGNAQVVDFEKLQAMLPEVPGWTRSEPRGEQMSMGIKMSRAEARYTNGDSTIRLEIQDTALSQMLLAPLSIFMASGYSERSSEGYKRSTSIGGQPGFEELRKNSREGEVTVVVGNRFIVSARGDEVDSTEPARKLIEAVDLAKLATMK